MRRSLWLGVGALAALLVGPRTGQAQLVDQLVHDLTHGVPMVGADFGAAFPLSVFNRSANPGGQFAPFIGYQIGDCEPWRSAQPG